jgi:hypothetical protein
LFATCPTCGNIFLLTPKGRKYCSATCRARGVGLAKSQKLHLNCLVCDKPIQVKPSHYRRGNGKYCSVECQHVAQRSISPTELHSLYWREHFSIRQIAQRCGVSRRAIQKKMTQYGIASRTQTEAFKWHTGHHEGIKQNPIEEKPYLNMALDCW